MNFYKNKSVSVTGAKGMIGRQLVKLLKEAGANVFEVDLPHYDLTNKGECLITEYVFHLAGIKGSPKKTNEQPADFMGPMLQFDTNMILAAQEWGVAKFLYTSSIAVENPETDFYPAWAKQTAEHLIAANKKQYPEGTQYCIVRPANVYGEHDNFKGDNAMVIPSLIRKMQDKEIPVEVWGDGTAIRDFIHTEDVARAMMLVMEKMPDEPINICSGKGISIKELADIIAKSCDYSEEIVYDTSKPTGNKVRVMDNKSLLELGFKQQISIEEGIKRVIDWRKNDSR